MRLLIVLLLAHVAATAEWTCLLERQVLRLSTWGSTLVVMTVDSQKLPQMLVSQDGGANWSPPLTAIHGVAGRLGVFYIADGNLTQWGGKQRLPFPGFVKSVVVDGNGTIWLGSDVIKRLDADRHGDPVLISTGKIGSIVASAATGIYASLANEGEVFLSRDESISLGIAVPAVQAKTSSNSDWLLTSAGMIDFSSRNIRRVRLDPPNLNAILDYQGIGPRLVALARSPDGVLGIFTCSPSIDDSWTTLPVGTIPPACVGLRIAGAKLMTFGPDGLWAMTRANDPGR